MEGIINSSPQGIFEESAKPYHKPGTRLIDPQTGDQYVYCKNGASALAPGKSFQSAVPDSNEVGIAVEDTAVAIGALSFDVTTGAAVTAGTYDGGIVVISAGTGVGYKYKIKTHEAVGSATTMRIYLEDDSPILVALASSDTKVDLVANPYNKVVVTPTTATALIRGISPIVVTAAYYFWGAVKGDFAGLIQGTPGVGVPVAASSSVAGAFAAYASGATPILTIPVGMMMEIGVNGKHKMVRINL